MSNSRDDALLIEVSLILLTFNQVTYVESAARSCLAQITSRPIEIIFSDDASSDGTFALLEDIAAQYQGPHRVRVRRNAANLGIGGHYNVVIAECSGELIVTAAGDDLSVPQRIERLYLAWSESGKNTDLITSYLMQMDQQGHGQSVIKVSDLANWTRPEQWFKKRPYVVGAAHAFTKRLHVQFGGFVGGVVYEDQIMTLRAILAGGCKIVKEPLVNYRDGGVSQQKVHAISGMQYVTWSEQNFSRQLAQYEQIRHDLRTVERLDLWSSKLAKRLAGARFVLDLHKKDGFWDRFKLLVAARGVRWHFRVKHFLYISWPEFAATIQRMQQIIKGR